MYTQDRFGSGEQDVSSWLVGFRRTRCLLRVGWVQENKMYTRVGWIQENKMLTQGRFGSGEQDVSSWLVARFRITLDSRN